jgi:hypothetical protein
LYRILSGILPAARQSPATAPDLCIKIRATASVQNAYKPSAFFDVEGWRWRARERDDSLPEAVEAEEELNFLAADDFADGFHGALAAGTFERIAAPCLQDEVTPEGAHVAGELFRRCGDEKDLGGRRFFGQRLGFGQSDDAVGDERGLATGFVGVGAVVADGLLALGREVKQRGGNEVGGFEDLEVALGVVVSFGAVDDGLGRFVPGDLLESLGSVSGVSPRSLTG